MPLIQVTAQHGLLSKKDQDALMSQMSNAVLKAEGASLEDAGAQSLVWAHYIEQPQGTMYVGGNSMEKAPLRVAVTTPEGALNDDARKTLIAEVGSIVDTAVGTFEDRLNHWVMLYELSDGGWGGAGSVFRLADIQAAMNIKAA